MKKSFMLLGFMVQLLLGNSQTPDFSKYPVYTGNDLGLTFTTNSSTLRIWAPTASAAELICYKGGTGVDIYGRYPMGQGSNGEWVKIMYGYFRGLFYTFRVKIGDKWSDEITDPYAKIVGVNGTRAMIADLKETDPFGWEKDKSPAFKDPTDAIIYELQIRDASISATSGIKNKGKYLGLTEKGTKNAAGMSTGLDHLKELGVTHVHLLPFFDFRSVDETKPDAKYNWGYDPMNYNVPDGSFSTDPSDGVTRIKEFKQLVKAFHDNGLSVVMDVVYNHTGLTEGSNFNQLVPGYYYRHTADGKFSNATACGNETASERPMFRKFMLESMIYWVKEYHIDGFRIDLMGVHDIETMNLISGELHKIKPGILLYGEGWTAGASPLDESLRAVKANAFRLDRIAVFSDDIRDGIKGSVFNHEEKGFASGRSGMEESIKFGVVASLQHPQVDYSKVNYSKAPYAAQPWNTISYCECHDNHTLYDKLAISAKEATEEERIEMQKLALSIVLTSQGISFLHAGTEFLRSKKGVENSFASPDSINAIDWDLKTKNKTVFDYVKGLIRMRKEHPAFRMTTAKEIAANIEFMTGMPPGVVGYTLNGDVMKDDWKKIIVLLNGTGKEVSVAVQPGKYHVAIAGNMFTKMIDEQESSWILKPYSCTVLYGKD